MKKYTCLFVCLLISIFSFAQSASFNINYYIGELNKTLQLTQDQQNALRGVLNASEQKQTSLKNSLKQLKESGEGNSEAVKNIKKEIKAIKMMEEKQLLELLTDEQKVLHTNRKKQRRYELQLEKMVEVLTLADSQHAAILAVIIDYNTQLDSIKDATNVVMAAKKKQELAAASPPVSVAMEEPSKKSKKKKTNETSSVMKPAKTETTIAEKTEQIKKLKITKRTIVDNYEDSLKVLLSPVQFDLYLRDKMLRPITSKLKQFHNNAGISEEVEDKLKILLVNYNQRKNRLVELGKTDTSYTKLKEDLKSIKTSFENQLSKLLNAEQIELFNEIMKNYVK